ncbi:hypothetical protein ADICYQ_4656 [Cyclobacterium qasimii M12-11B]|uniref:Lipocalin-like domain-containing protein n=2 Tax=Cyclobacterium qasimii TaxID=1350429 RepID=S7V9T6_9BACT|nr:hypothetical protein ADICYQ_4656 [Cyclobacterium qasimii M12-11B]
MSIISKNLQKSLIMKSALFFGLVIFILSIKAAVGQGMLESKPIELIGYWQTDSVSQLGVKERILLNENSLDYKALSSEMGSAIKSREYFFQDEGIFTAKWVMGKKQIIVTGKWDVIEKNKVTIEVDGVKTKYSVKANGKEGILLVPLRERNGEIHELYFIKKKVK